MLLRVFPNSVKINPLKYFACSSNTEGGTFKPFTLQEPSQERVSHLKILIEDFSFPIPFHFHLKGWLVEQGIHFSSSARENFALVFGAYSNQEIELFLIFIKFFSTLVLLLFCFSRTTFDFTSANLPLFSLKLKVKILSFKKFDPTQKSLAKIPSILKITFPLYSSIV